MYTKVTLLNADVVLVYRDFITNIDDFGAKSPLM